MPCPRCDTTTYMGETRCPKCQWELRRPFYVRKRRKSHNPREETHLVESFDTEITEENHRYNSRNYISMMSVFLMIFISFFAYHSIDCFINPNQNNISASFTWGLINIGMFLYLFALWASVVNIWSADPIMAFIGIPAFVAIIGIPASIIRCIFFEEGFLNFLGWFALISTLFCTFFFLLYLEHMKKRVRNGDKPSHVVEDAIDVVFSDSVGQMHQTSLIREQNRILKNQPKKIK